ncbi:lipopolysaccharide biosynthesis protein [Oenococcus sp. UCMA 16435]|nr:lipopolysaccharide biosynthesis protein [Oenococcus sp. UCMA 16435]
MNQAFKNGIFFSFIGRYGNFLITLAVNLLLSRMLTPNEYGQVGNVLIFISFFQLLSNAGIGAAIIQHQDLTAADIESIYSFSGILSLMLMLLFPIIGLLLSFFYGSIQYFYLSLPFALAVLFYSLIVIPNAYLMKELRFKVLNLTQLLTSFVGGVSGVIAALAGLGVYALVINTVFATFLDYFVKIYITRMKFGKLRRDSLDKVLNFSINMFFGNVLQYFSQNFDNFLVGKVYGASALGNYGKAYQLLRYPNYLVSGIFTSILVPVLADKQDNINLLRESYYKVMKTLAYIGFALSSFFIIDAKEIILFLFGNQWGKAVLPFKYLSISVWVQVLYSIISPMFEVRNLTKNMRKLIQKNTLIMVSFIIVGIILGNISRLSLLVSAGFITTYFISLYSLSKDVLRTSFFEVIRKLIKPIIMSTIIAICLIIAKNILIPNLHSTFLILFSQGSVFILVSLIILSIFGEMKNIVNIFLRK